MDTENNASNYHTHTEKREFCTMKTKLAIGLASGVMATGLTFGIMSFTGGKQLEEIESTAKDMADRIINLDTTKDNYKEALDALQVDAENLLNNANDKLVDKNTKIWGLTDTVADLTEQLANIGNANTDELDKQVAEVARLTAEVEKANNEVEATSVKVAAEASRTASKGDTVEEVIESVIPEVVDNTSEIFGNLTEESKKSINNGGIYSISDIDRIDGVYIVTAKVFDEKKFSHISNDSFTKALQEASTYLNIELVITNELKVMDAEGKIHYEGTYDSGNRFFVSK